MWKPTVAPDMCWWASLTIVTVDYCNHNSAVKQRIGVTQNPLVYRSKRKCFVLTARSSRWLSSRREVISRERSFSSLLTDATEKRLIAAYRETSRRTRARHLCVWRASAMKTRMKMQNCSMEATVVRLLQWRLCINERLSDQTHSVSVNLYRRSLHC